MNGERSSQPNISGYPSHPCVWSTVGENPLQQWSKRHPIFGEGPPDSLTPETLALGSNFHLPSSNQLLPILWFPSHGLDQESSRTGKSFSREGNACVEEKLLVLQG